MPDVDTDAIRTQVRFVLDELRREAGGLSDAVITPGFVEEKLEGVTRVGQVIAFLVLGPVIVASFQLIRAFHELLAAALGAQPLGATQDPIFAWIVSGLTIAMILLAAWGWFQFVRTAGFGWFHMQEDF